MTRRTKVPPMAGLTYQNVETFSAYYGADEERFFVADLDKAHVITSRQAGQDEPYHSETNPRGIHLDSMLHKLVIDVDMPAVLVPSSTPGHFHLFIDHTMSWRKYVRLLRALSDAGIVEPGYVKAAERRGFTTVRLPWVKKPAEPIRRVDGSGSLPENRENF